MKNRKLYTLQMVPQGKALGVFAELFLIVMSLLLLPENHLLENSFNYSLK